MPTNRKRKLHNRRHSAMPEDVWEYVNDLPMPEGGNVWAWGEWDELPEYWKQLKQRVLNQWTRSYPGTRPSCWWEFDATEGRQCLSILDKVTHERFIKSGWDRRGLPKDIIFLSVLDFENPVLFESQTTYLDRMGELSKLEKSKLSKSDFEPEKYEYIQINRKKQNSKVVTMNK